MPPSSRRSLFRLTTVLGAAFFMTDFDTAVSAAQTAKATGDALSASNTTLTQQNTDLQAAFDAYKKSHPDPTPPPPPVPSGARFPGDPGLGNVYVGESNQGGDPTSDETSWGTSVGAFRSYFQWNQNQTIADRAARDLAKHRIPFISFKDDLSSGAWAKIASGAQDTVLKDLMAKLGALSGPVWLCLHHEPYGDSQGTAADYAAANKHLMSLRPKNVAIAPILQSAPFDPTVGGSQSIAAWYPEGSYDLIGLDTYNHKWYVPAPGGNKYRDPATVLSVLDKVRKDLGKPDVPIAIAEFGVRTDPANPGKAAQWLADFVAQAKLKNVPALCYFNSNMNVNDGGTYWSLIWTGDGTSGNERQKAYGPLVKANAHL